MQGHPDPKTTNEALAAFGLKTDKATQPEQQDIWPDNLHAFNVFYRLRTQWIMGFNGAVGLRMESLAMAMELESVPRHLWPAVTDGVQAMEAETLRLWREKR